MADTAEDGANSAVPSPEVETDRQKMKKKLSRFLAFFLMRRPTVSALRKKKVVGPAVPGGFGVYDWKEDTGSAWSNCKWRVIDGDIPRLARRMKIFSEFYQEQLTASQIVLRDRTVSFHQDAPNGFDHIALVLTCLTHMLETTEVQRKLDQELLSRLDSQRTHGGMTDVGTVSDLLMATVGENSRVVGVLKGINQSALAPAAMEMRQTLTMRFPFKDTKNGWTVSIRQLPDATISVTHERTEEGLSNPVSNYKFSWELTLLFDEAVKTMLNVYIRIKEVDFHKDFDPEARQEFVSAAGTLGEPLEQVDEAGLHFANACPHPLHSGPAGAGADAR